MNFFKILLFLVCFISTKETYSRTCVDLPEEKKRDMLAEWESFYRKYITDILESTKKWQPGALISNSSKYRDSKSCNETLNSKNYGLTMRESLCPWKYQVIKREDKYPIYIYEARCGIFFYYLKDYSLVFF